MAGGSCAALTAGEAFDALLWIDGAIGTERRAVGRKHGARAVWPAAVDEVGAGAAHLQRQAGEGRWIGWGAHVKTESKGRAWGCDCRACQPVLQPPQLPLGTPPHPAPVHPAPSYVALDPVCEQASGGYARDHQQAGMVCLYPADAPAEEAAQDDGQRGQRGDAGHSPSWHVVCLQGVAVVPKVKVRSGACTGAGGRRGKSAGTNEGNGAIVPWVSSATAAAAPVPVCCACRGSRAHPPYPTCPPPPRTPTGPLPQPV